MSKQAIGIIGGMGPMATLDLFGKIIARTDAKTDAEHIRVYIDCHTGIPDRTQAILYGGESPVPHILESAKKLATMGADFLLIPCNTSHYFYEEIVAGSPVPVMNMVRTAAEELERRGISRVGLLATDGTLRSGVYQKELAARNIETLCPTDAEQREVMRLIYEGVKADAPTFDTTVLLSMTRRLKRAGAECLVLGCTELPLGFERYGLPCENVLDPTDILACAAVKAAGYRARE